jgi:hypothetical protein
VSGTGAQRASAIFVAPPATAPEICPADHDVAGLDRLGPAQVGGLEQVLGKVLRRPLARDATLIRGMKGLAPAADVEE